MTGKVKTDFLQYLVIARLNRVGSVAGGSALIPCDGGLTVEQLAQFWCILSKSGIYVGYLGGVEAGI